MGGVGWSNDCGPLLDFYRDQAAEIKEVRFTFDAYLEDWRSVKMSKNEISKVNNLLLGRI